MTYPDPAVIQMVTERFVPLRLDHRDPNVRKLNLLWLPTLYVLDKREEIHGRSVNSLPPEDLLDVLDLAEAHARMKGGKAARADELLSAALARREHGPLTDEQGKQTAYIAKAAEDLGQIVDDLLDLARIAAGKSEVRVAAFSVSTLFSALRGMFRPLHGVGAVQVRGSQRQPPPHAAPIVDPVEVPV